jgi:hypothetical protein
VESTVLVVAIAIILRAGVIYDVVYHYHTVATIFIACLLILDEDFACGLVEGEDEVYIVAPVFNLPAVCILVALIEHEVFVYSGFILSTEELINRIIIL